MTYQIKIEIREPQKTYNVIARFYQNEKDYGNGYFVSITGNEFEPLYYDLRYHISLTKKQWLKDWANRYWGKNLKSVTII